MSVPKLISVINKEMNRVELQFDGRNKSFPSVCIQYEKNGRCQVSVVYLCSLSFFLLLLLFFAEFKKVKLTNSICNVLSDQQYKDPNASSLKSNTRKTSNTK